jgi:probable rRNA maturation factor
VSADANHPGPEPAILVSNRQELPVDADDLAALARAVLVAEDASDGELSVSFVSDEEIAELHRRFLGESGPTDVLSFPLDEETEPGGPRLLGDVVIAPDYAQREGRAGERELRLLLVHGILHLLGYDHEEDEERAVMWARQESYSGVRV